LTAKQKKFCACIAKVRRSKTAYNPYAICAKSTGTSMGRRGCLSYYNFGRNSKLSDTELSNITKNERKAFRQQRSKRRSRTSRSRRSHRRSRSKSPRQRRKTPKNRTQLLKALESLVKSKYR
jgi:hypothetical protein